MTKDVKGQLMTKPTDIDKPTKPKKNKKRNRGANKIITQRPTGNGHRLTSPEKFAIRAEKDTGKSAMAVSKTYGCAKQTVQRLWKDGKLSTQAHEVSRLKEGIADSFLIAAGRGVEKVTELFGSVKDVQRAATATGIMFDKYRLMSGETTSNQPVHIWLGLVNSVPVDSDFDKAKQIN